MVVKEYQGASQLSQVKSDPVNVKRPLSAHKGIEVTTRNVFRHKAQLLMGLKESNLRGDCDDKVITTHWISIFN